MSDEVKVTAEDCRIYWNGCVAHYAVQVLEHHSDGDWWQTVAWAKTRCEAESIAEARRIAEERGYHSQPASPRNED